MTRAVALTFGRKTKTLKRAFCRRMPELARQPQIVLGMGSIASVRALLKHARVLLQPLRNFMASKTVDALDLVAMPMA
jgi:hypothetical protein